MYYSKYLKYKQKYINLKGGTLEFIKDEDKYCIKKENACANIHRYTEQEKDNINKILDEICNNVTISGVKFEKNTLEYISSGFFGITVGDNNYVLKFIKTEDSYNEIGVMIKLLELQNKNEICENIVNIFLIYVSENECFEKFYKKNNVDTTKLAQNNGNMSVFIMEKYDSNIQNHIIDNNKFIANMTNALKYLKTHNITHNDIKSDNIMLKGNEYILIDFGIAFYIKKECESKNTKEFVNREICNGVQSHYIDLFAVIKLLNNDENIKKNTLVYLCCLNLLDNLIMSDRIKNYITYQNLLAIMYMIDHSNQIKVYCLEMLKSMILFENIDELKKYIYSVMKIMTTNGIMAELSGIIKSVVLVDYDIPNISYSKIGDKHGNEYDNAALLGL